MTDTDAVLLIDEPLAGVKRISFNRPQALNALTLDMVRSLDGELAALGADPGCRVILLAGRGRAFCAGLDIKSNSDSQSSDPGVALKIEIQETFAAIPKRIRSLPQPVIAVMQGPVVGAGLAMTLAADIRIASHSLKCLIGAVKLGLSAGETGISYHLPRLIGASRAFEIMLTGRAVLAAEAERCGLVSRLVDDEALEAESLALAEELLSNSPYALTATKQVMWANLEAPSLDVALALENQTQIVGSLTEDFVEASQAFMQKRKPEFKGR